MHYTESHHLNISSPDLDFLNHNQPDEFLVFNRNQSPLSTDFEMNAVNPLEGENPLYWFLNFEKDVKRKAIVDSVTYANAKLAKLLEKLRDASSIFFSEFKQALFLIVKVASESNVKVFCQIDVHFKFDEHKFEGNFLTLPSMNTVVLGNPFFFKYSFENSPEKTYSNYHKRLTK